MTPRLSDRLASLAMALIVTLGLAGGIHAIAASEAANAVAAATAAAAGADGSGHMAHSTGAPACARV